jgi:hypothetical protein
MGAIAATHIVADTAVAAAPPGRTPGCRSATRPYSSSRPLRIHAPPISNRIHARGFLGLRPATSTPETTNENITVGNTIVSSTDDPAVSGAISAQTTQARYAVNSIPNTTQASRLRNPSLIRRPACASSSRPLPGAPSECAVTRAFTSMLDLLRGSLCRSTTEPVSPRGVTGPLREDGRRLVGA